MVALTGPDALNVCARRLRPYLSELIGNNDDPATALDGTAAFGDINAEVKEAALAIRAQFPCIVVYANLSPPDQEWFDRAAGIKAAIGLLEPFVAAAHDGQAKLKTPDFEYTFTTPGPEARKALATELAEAIGYISAVRALRRRAPNTGIMFGANGVAKARQQECQTVNPLGFLRLIVPDGWIPF